MQISDVLNLSSETVQLHGTSHLTLRLFKNLILGNTCYLHGSKFSVLLSPNFGCYFTQLLIIRKTKQIPPMDAGLCRKPRGQKAKEHHKPLVLNQEVHCTIFPWTAKPQEWINITNHKRDICVWMCVCVWWRGGAREEY